MKQKTQFISLQLLPRLMKFYPPTEVKVILFLSDITPASSVLFSSWASWFGGLVWLSLIITRCLLPSFFYDVAALGLSNQSVQLVWNLRFQKTVGIDYFGNPWPRDIGTTAQYKWYRWGSVEKPLQLIVHLPLMWGFEINTPSKLWMIRFWPRDLCPEGR